MRWIPWAIGLLVLAAIAAGVGGMAYQAGLANGLVQVGASGAAPGTPGLSGMPMYPPYAHGWGWHHGFGFLPFGLLGMLFWIVILFGVFRLLFWGGLFRHFGGPGGHGGWEGHLRETHDVWHRGPADGTRNPPGSSPPGAA